MKKFMYTLINPFGKSSCLYQNNKKAKCTFTLQIFKHAIYYLSQIAI